MLSPEQKQAAEIEKEITRTEKRLATYAKKKKMSLKDTLNMKMDEMMLVTLKDGREMKQ